MTCRVLIVGGSGLLALNWAMTERHYRHIVLGLHRRVVALPGTTSAVLQMGTEAGFEEELLALRPDLVVNAAALTSVEECEADQPRAFWINAALPGMIGRLCARHRIPLVHVSTDHLFSGDHAMVTEQEPLAPMNAYGASKGEGERLVQRVNPDALIVRTNFYGWGTGYRRSFSDFIIDSLKAGKRIDLFTDVFYTPILASRLVRAIMDLLNAGFRGLIHLVGDERLSKHQFGLRVAQQFDLDSNLIRPAQFAEQAVMVRRPLDMSLSNALARRVLGRPICTIEDGLHALADEEAAGMASELRALA